MRAKSYKEYSSLATKRREIISENRSRRMRKGNLPPLEVPEKVKPPLVPVAYDNEGIYICRLESSDSFEKTEEGIYICVGNGDERLLPIGSKIKWEEAQW